MSRTTLLSHLMHKLNFLLLIEIFAVDHNGLAISELLAPFAPPPQRDTLGLDKIFMINLQRRADRREKMRQCFSELGLEATEVKAVDGR
jgi:collagen beta-1,O-galactosyltransferase